FKLHHTTYSPAPHFDLQEEAALQAKIAELIKGGFIQSAHDISEGGLFTTLLESAMAGDLGGVLNLGTFDQLEQKGIRKDAFLFGESQSRVVVSVRPEQQASFEAAMGDHPYDRLGTVTGSHIIMDGEDWGNIQVWKEKYDTAIEQEL